MSNLEVFSLGTEVEICGGVVAKITGIMIEPGPSVSYRVIWCNDKTICDRWVPEISVQKHDPDRLKIGFR